MLVLFYFYGLGYTPFQLATVFAFYEIFGIITNLVGGFLAARFGLKTTLVMGLVVQIVALLMLGARARARGWSSATSWSPRRSRASPRTSRR